MKTRPNRRVFCARRIGPPNGSARPYQCSTRGSTATVVTIVSTSSPLPGASSATISGTDLARRISAASRRCRALPDRPSNRLRPAANAGCIRQGAALDRPQHGVPGQLRLAATVSFGPAGRMENNRCARTCGRHQKPEIGSGAALLPACESSLKLFFVSFGFSGLRAFARSR